MSTATVDHGGGNVTPAAGTGRENASRLTSRIRAAAVFKKPVIKPMPRFDKSTYCAENGSETNSSPVPRGRSCIPSKFVRNRGSRVSIDTSRVSENVHAKKFSFWDSDVCQNVISKHKDDHKGKEMELMDDHNGISWSGVLNVIKINSISSRLNFESLNPDSILKSGVKSFEGVRILENSKVKETVEKREDVVHMGLRGSVGKSLNELSGLESNPEKGVGRRTANTHTSKLHEKLAFLEGKVKNRITFFETIARIEKGLGLVANNDDKKSGLGKFNEDANPQIFETKIEQPISELKVEEMPMCSIDENLTAIECLASSDGKGSANLEIYEVQENEDVMDSAEPNYSDGLKGKDSDEIMLTGYETPEDSDIQGNVQDMKIDLENEDSLNYELNGIGQKICNAGWFVSDETVLLAYADGSCSVYDVLNNEEKVEYKPRADLMSNLWRDCWILSGPGSDGSLGRYVVAASAGNSVVSGFCSWDFYSKEVLAYVTRDDGLGNTKTAPAPSPDNSWGGPHGKGQKGKGIKGISIYPFAGSSCGKGAKNINSLSKNSPNETPRWWYKPCGPIIISTGTCRKTVKLYDIRDGESILKWKLEKPVLSMEYSSPLQWRSKGKVVIAEADDECGETIISLCDVVSLNPKSLLSVSSAGRKVTALHVNNRDAEPGGGVRERITSSEAEGNDGIFCTADDINVLDFRIPSGIGLKIPQMGAKIVQSVFSRGDSIYLGCKSLGGSLIEQFSIRTQKLFSVYTLPEEFNQENITQVWGNSKVVMGVSGAGLFVFDPLKDDAVSQDTSHKGKSVIGEAQKVKVVIGPNDMFSPSFDYLGSRVLLISGDCSAMWRYLKT